MSISSALQTGVSGLQANAKVVGNISENIANANTVGYRRGFSELVTTTAAGDGTGVLSVLAVERLDINTPGGLLSTTTATDLSIGGDGFFAVTQRPNETVPSQYALTRAGSFRPDVNGDLKNAAGFFLAGYAYDINGEIGDVDRGSFFDMQTVNIGNVALTAQGTQNITTFGNLPAQDTGAATPGAPFTASSEFFTDLGAAERVTFSWQPTATDNVWDLTVRDHTDVDLGMVTVEFNDSGVLAGSPGVYSASSFLGTAPSAFSFNTADGIGSITLDVGTTPQTIQFALGAPNTFDGVTQFAGDFSQAFEVDGSSTGQLLRTEINENGTMFGVFDNGDRRPLYQIPIAQVSNPNALIELKGNAYSLSAETGTFFAQVANTGTAGNVTSGALETSNVDIALEMTELIKSQRAYSINARIVTTVDEIMDETTRLKR